MQCAVQCGTVVAAGGGGEAISWERISSCIDKSLPVGTVLLGSRMVVLPGRSILLMQGMRLPAWSVSGPIEGRVSLRRRGPDVVQSGLGRARVARRRLCHPPEEADG